MTAHRLPALAILVLLVAAALAPVSTSASPDELSNGKLHPVLARELQTASLASGDSLRTIVQFSSFEARDSSLIERFGARVHYELTSIPALLVLASPAALARIAAMPEVLRIEYDQPIEYDLDTAVIAGRAIDLWGVPAPEITLPDGSIIDGSGVGVAVVDTGVNALHPDLEYGTRVKMNLHAVGAAPLTLVTGGPLFFQEMEHTDGGNHGSHVAGIVGGSGAAGGGRFVGAAPGASIYGFGSHVGSFWYALAAWDWVYQHGAAQDPPVRIITNSWGFALGEPCDKTLALTQVQQKLILERGVTMFFSAGNAGRGEDGTVDRTRTQFKCPWQGNIGVASMDDENSGNREGPPSEFTSKGLRDDPWTWPDLSGPGSNVTAVAGSTSEYAQCASLDDPVARCYSVKSGTSMSTPFVAGVGALLLQARPDLRPADIEFILEQTAYKFRADEDPYHEDPEQDYRLNGSHHVKGHGLVDAEAAVAFALEYDPATSPVVHEEYELPALPIPLLKLDEVVDPASGGVAIPGLGVVLASVAMLGVAIALRRKS